MGLRFSDDGPLFPGALLDAMLEGDVVFLCGAGVSSPQLPGFAELVKKVYARLMTSATDGEVAAIEAGRYEEALGALSRRLVDPKQLYSAVTHLLTPSAPDLTRHRSLLRLSRARDNRIMLVTTNFDTLFEQAVGETLDRESTKRISLAGQALPPPGSDACHGIIHLHGRIVDPGLDLDATPVVLTSAEYGDAYMRSGWAARFLFDLVRCKTIVLIGYKAGDAPVRYFLNLLEGDRARFDDLRVVYALDSYESDPAEADARWSTIAVTPLPYKKLVGSGDPYLPLWRDLGRLAEFVERPRAERRQRARALLSQPFANTIASQRDEVVWLLTGKGQLWDIVTGAVKDPAWFDYFQGANLWDVDVAAQVIANWCAIRPRDVARLEAAIAWRQHLGGSLPAVLGRRMGLLLEKLERPWDIAWKTLIHAPTRSEGLRQFSIARSLESGRGLDRDLRCAVAVLTPSLQIRRRWRLESGGQADSPRSLRDIAHVSLELEDDGDISALNALLRALPNKRKRLAQLATEALATAAYSAADVDLISQDWDAVDRSVPSVEAHEQNLYHDGVVQLCVLLTDLLPLLADEDLEFARTLSNSWRDIPSSLGHRMWTHAQRNPTLFSCDEALANVLALPRSAFWSMRRELVLTLRERSYGAAPDLVQRIVERVLGESAALYADFEVSAGETDWRPQATSHRVWLLLSPLRMAGVLPAIGHRELASISGSYPFIAGDYEEQDLFGSFSSGVRPVTADPSPLVNAAKGDRLSLARRLQDARDFEMQGSWSAYCRSEPIAAFEILKEAELKNENARLWSDFLNVLVTATLQERSNSKIPEIIAGSFDLLSTAPDSFVALQVQPLTYLLAPFESVATEPDVVRRWWDRLWSLTESFEEALKDEDTKLFFDRVINRPAGRLVGWLLASIDGSLGSRKIADADAARLESVVSSDTAAGWLGRGMCARYSSFLLKISPRVALGTFRASLIGNSQEAKSLRATMLGGPELTAQALRAFGTALVMALYETDATEGGAVNGIAHLLSPLVRWRMTPTTEKPPITPAAVRSVLRGVSPAILAAAASFLNRIVRGWIPGDSARMWRTFVSPIFDDVWPNEVKFKRASVSRELAALCVSAGDAFPEAFEHVRHYLSPLEGGWGGIWFMKQGDVVKNSPISSLELLWILFGPTASGHTGDLAEVLDIIVASAPSLEVDRRLQWLEQHRAVRYE